MHPLPLCLLKGQTLGRVHAHTVDATNRALQKAAWVY